MRWPINVPNVAVDKGKRAERAVAAYFRDSGMPTAERFVRTGWRTSTRESSDCGDVLVPGVCCQVKDYTRTGLLKGKLLDDLMADVRAQADAAGAAIPLLIEKHKGHASPGDWWAWLPSDVYAAMLIGVSPRECRLTPTHPVRVELRHIIGRIASLSVAYAARAA